MCIEPSVFFLPRSILILGVVCTSVTLKKCAVLTECKCFLFFVTALKEENKRSRHFDFKYLSGWGLGFQPGRVVLCTGITRSVQTRKLKGRRVNTVLFQPIVG